MSKKKLNEYSAKTIKYMLQFGLTSWHLLQILNDWNTYNNSDRQICVLWCNEFNRYFKSPAMVIWSFMFQKIKWSIRGTILEIQLRFDPPPPNFYGIPDRTKQVEEGRWRNYGTAGAEGPAAAGDRQKGAQKDPFPSHIGRDREFGTPFWDPAGFQILKHWGGVLNLQPPKNWVLLLAHVGSFRGYRRHALMQICYNV